MPVLERRLAEALAGDEHGPLGLAWPATAVQEAEHVGSFRVSGLGPRGSFVVGARLELAHLTERLSGIDIRRQGKALRASRIVACADEEEFGVSVQVAKWMLFETTIEHIRYVFHQGRWYRIGEPTCGKCVSRRRCWNAGTPGRR